LYTQKRRIILFLLKYCLLHNPSHMFEKILSLYGLSTGAIIEPLGSGLINDTWKISEVSNEYVLQKINPGVFKQPHYIINNIEAIASHLEKFHPEYFFITPLKTKDGEALVHLPGEGYFRIFPFVKDSISYDVVQNPEQAFESARQFGLFTRNLREFPAESLETTLPDFHNLGYRFQQFEQAIEQGNASRVSESKELIQFIQSQEHLVFIYKKIISGEQFRLRVTHHDTKISNVLFDKDGKGICVIDLDTVMPGYFISDVGDMMRTYLSPASEEEKDLDKIEVREDYFKAILKGYFQEMSAELSAEEIRHFVYAGMFTTYMQAIRFLTDHLYNDIYYGASYAGHNYARAKNQITLLERLIEKDSILSEMVFETADNLLLKNVKG
jgi:Ser/Thr protein kinase RdoA (MazF antagonist)